MARNAKDRSYCCSRLWLFGAITKTDTTLQVQRDKRDRGDEIPCPSQHHGEIEAPFIYRTMLGEAIDTETKLARCDYKKKTRGFSPARRQKSLSLYILPEVPPRRCCRPSLDTRAATFETPPPPAPASSPPPAPRGGS